MTVQVVGTIETAPEAVGTGYRGPDEVPARLHREDSAMEQSSPLYVRTRSGNIRRANRPHASQLRRVRAEVMRRDNFTCQGCGIRAEAPRDYDGSYAPRILGSFWMELDHILRYRDGGEFSVGNLRAMCQRCNAKRG